MTPDSPQRIRRKDLQTRPKEQETAPETLSIPAAETLRIPVDDADLSPSENEPSSRLRKVETNQLTSPADSGTVGAIDRHPLASPGEPSPQAEPVAALKAYLENLGKPETFADAEEQLQQFLTMQKGLRQVVRAWMQSVLNASAGEASDDFAANAQFVKDLNAVRGAFTLLLRLKNSDMPVYLRCLRPPRSTPSGTFQAISADAKRKSAYSGSQFPSLKAEISR